MRFQFFILYLKYEQCQIENEKLKSHGQKLKESSFFKSKMIHKQDDDFIHQLSWFADNEEYLHPDNIMLRSDTTGFSPLYTSIDVFGLNKPLSRREHVLSHCRSDVHIRKDLLDELYEDETELGLTVASTRLPTGVTKNR
jgi:hypothetical protein